MRYLVFIGLFAWAACGLAQDTDQTAQALFRTLTGTPLALGDARLAQMKALIAAGKIKEAAAIATEDENFYNTTLLHWASHMGTRDEFQRTPLNDFSALIIGTAAEDRDAREMLSADAWYVGADVSGLPALDATNNDHFNFLERSRAPLRRHLRRVSPQRADLPGAGLLTTWTFLKEHAAVGTNRRAVEFTFREFLCKPMRDLADLTAPRDRIRQDVDRAPGGSTAAFNGRCAGCHSVMDGFGGAFAFFNFTFIDMMTKERGRAVITPGVVAGKMNQNAATYPAGYRTLDDSFVNYARFNSNEALGWRGPVDGQGVAEFGALVAGSKQFSRCMALRTYTQLCLNGDYVVDRLTPSQQAQLATAEADITELAEGFETDGYKLKGLFAATAAKPKCWGRP